MHCASVHLSILQVSFELCCFKSRPVLCALLYTIGEFALAQCCRFKCRHKNPQKPSIIFVVCKKCDCASDSNSPVCCNFYCSQIATKYQKTWQSRAGLMKKAFLLQSFSLIANTNERQSISPWYHKWLYSHQCLFYRMPAEKSLIQILRCHMETRS